jgi:hypothetical protein
MGAEGARSILVLGGPGAGKTVYAAQALGRLQARAGKVELGGAAPSVAPLEEARERLAQGRASAHTPTDTYEEVRLPIELPGYLRAELTWPDYGGEQVRTIIRERRIKPEWRARVERGQGWLLFVRPDQIRLDEDVQSRPPHEVEPTREAEPDDGPEWATQAELVELLQMLLFVKGVGTARRTETPPLAVLLSCWDELGDQEARMQPPRLLRARAPLLADFVASVWREDAASVWGLSSQGRALREDEPDEEYIEQGPQSFGYVVPPGGGDSSDLTLPLAYLLERLR